MKEMMLLDRLCKMPTKIIRGLEYLLNEDRLGELGLFGLEKSRLQGDLRAAFQRLKRTCQRPGEDFIHGLAVTGQRKIVVN